MARIRSVHPDICLSETMAVLSADLERTFVRLWTHCDDEGRCLDNPRLIKAAIYPLHDGQTWQVVDGELDELERAGLLWRYEVDGEQVLQVRSWGEYQKPQKPRPSSLPPRPLPEQSRTTTRPLLDEYASGVGEGEGVGEGVRSRSIAPAARPRNEIWDALAAVFGEPTTDTNRTLRGKVCSSLQRAGAAPEEVLVRAGRWPAYFPEAELTETALEKHWDRLGRPPLQVSRDQVDKFTEEQRREARRREAAAMDQAKGLPG